MFVKREFVNKLSKERFGVWVASITNEHGRIHIWVQSMSESEASLIYTHIQLV